MYIIVKSGAGATILTGCDQKIDKLKSENMEKSTHKKIMWESSVFFIVIFRYVTAQLVLDNVGRFSMPEYQGN